MHYLNFLRDKKNKIPILKLQKIINYYQRNNNNRYEKIILNKIYNNNLEVIKGKKKIKNCPAGKNFLVIDSYGDFYPCEPFNVFWGGKSKSISYGNILKLRGNICRAITNSSISQKIQEIKKNGCTCTYECSQVCYYVLNPFRLLFKS